MKQALPVPVHVEKSECGTSETPCLLWKGLTIRYHPVQAPKSEALAGRLSAVYGVMAAQDIIKQRQSHPAHKSQVSFWPLCSA